MIYNLYYREVMESKFTLIFSGDSMSKLLTEADKDMKKNQRHKGGYSYKVIMTPMAQLFT
jgi:hypothetical protein